jgi:UDP-N-acetyl-D-mannosaminuronate dehydrogenase
VTAAALKDKISSSEARIAVIGLGYVGLPLALSFAREGFTVVGLDVDAAKVATLRRGESYILDVPSEHVRDEAMAGRFSATTDADVLRDVDVIFVSVPTPFDRAKQPDLRFVVSAAESLASRLRPGQLVILESTTYPGTTDEVMRPILERSGMKAGRDFFLAFSPERIDPGNKRFRIENTPKVVGGVDPVSTDLAAEVLTRVVTKGSVHRVSSAKAAELTKLLENTFRAVNIALVNELAMLCDRMEIDIWEVIEAASTKPYGFMPFFPGPGVGGHCLATGETIVVRDGERVGPRSVDAVWRQAARRTAPRRAGASEVIDRPELAVLGIGVDGPAGWEPVTHLFKRPFDGELIEVRTIDGREIVVTDEHPMLVAGPAGVDVKLARDVAPGDLLPLVGEIAQPSAGDPVVDVIGAIRPDLRPKVRVAIRDGSWAAFRSLLRIRYGPARTHDWVRCRQVPLSVFLELCAESADLPAPDRLVLWTGRGPGRTSLDAVVRLTPDVARMIGYYATEGCITTDGSERVRFTFHAQEAEVVHDLCATLAALGQRWSISRDRSAANVHVKVSSQLFATLIRDALGCGVSSYDAAVPEILLGASREHRLALFAGLLRGDGSVDARTGPRAYERNGRSATAQNNSANVGFWTTSVRLEKQFSFLAQSLGLRTSIHRRRTQTGADFHILGVDVQPMLASLLADAKAAKLTACLAAKRRTPRSRGTWSMAGQSVAAVGSVLRRRASTTVFSIETAATHTFASGLGIFVHNCIPVDPYYLSWKAREFDFHTKFIELAAETNLAMPFFTAGRIRRLLGRHDLALHGAKVLVLGAAFKKDIDDARNSTAIRVMEILRSEGASITYHDPYVPEIHLAASLYAGEGNGGVPLRSIDLTEGSIAAADAVAILVGHSSVDYEMVLRHARAVFDAVNATRGLERSAHAEKL